MGILQQNILQCKNGAVSFFYLRSNKKQFPWLFFARCGAPSCSIPQHNKPKYKTPRREKTERFALWSG